MTMKLTIVYDNEAYNKELDADWGFSCLIEACGRRILFDTGASGPILLGNMKKLGIDPRSIDEVFISHSHFDHTGGLSSFLRANPKATTYVPASFRPPAAGNIVSVKEPGQLHPNLFSTGELGGIEQSLAVKVEGELVVIAGCSHPGIGNIMRAASQFGKVSALVGGFHSFSELRLLKELRLVCPCHCTQRKAEIRKAYPLSCVEGGAGKVIEVWPG